MIGYTLLNEIIHHKGIYDTAVILETLHQNVVVTLKQTASNDNNGMDICLCRIIQENNTPTLYFSGAKRPLYIARQTEFLHFVGTRRYIGGRIGTEKQFEVQRIELQKQDMLFLFSDGYADQNNVQRDSFGTKNMLTLFKENANLPCRTQKVILETALLEHMQHAEQRDDITIIGVKI
jgi:serine phosphatase RsbU (regulator of sigma subunit)